MHEQPGKYRPSRHFSAVHPVSVVHIQLSLTGGGSTQGRHLGTARTAVARQGRSARCEAEPQHDRNRFNCQLTVPE